LAAIGALIFGSGVIGAVAFALKSVAQPKTYTPKRIRVRSNGVVIDFRIVTNPGVQGGFSLSRPDGFRYNVGD